MRMRSYVSAGFGLQHRPAAAGSSQDRGALRSARP